MKPKGSSLSPYPPLPLVLVFLGALILCCLLFLSSCAPRMGTIAPQEIVLTIKTPEPSTIEVADSSTTRFEKEPLPYPMPGGRFDYYRHYVQDGIGYFLITTIDHDAWLQVDNALRVFDRYNVEKAVVIIVSHGGSLFQGMAIAQRLEEWGAVVQKVVETRTYGLSASAACFIMLAGTPGHRYMAKTAMIMIHELATFKYFAVESVSDTEKEAKVKRLIQDTTIKFMAARTLLSPDELKEKCREESWFLADTAKKWGFIDHIISGGKKK